MSDISSPAVDAAQKTAPKNPNADLSLEALIELIRAERLKHLKSQSDNQFKELKAAQKEVATLQDLIQSINAATKADGTLDLEKNPDLKAQIDAAKELGVEVNAQNKFNKEERDRLIENIRMTIQNKNTDIDMQLQTTSLLTSECFETYQMLRQILKPAHEMKLACARATKGG